MYNGRLIHFDKLQIQCGYTGATVGSIVQYLEGFTELNVSTYLATPYDTFSSGQQIGIEMQMLGIVARPSDWMPPPGGLSYGYTYSLKFLGTTFSASASTGDFPASGSTFLDFENFEVWMLNSGYWQTQWSSVNWYSGDPDGSYTLLDAVDSARAVQSDAPIPVPSMIPIFNGILDFSGNGLAPPIGFNSTNNNYGLFMDGVICTASVYGTAACGWRATEDGGSTWIAPPVAFLASEIGSTGTSWEPNFSFGATMTYTMETLGPSVDQPGQTVWGIETTSSYASGAFRLMPCGPFATLRANPDHEAPISIGAVDSYQYLLTTVGESGTSETTIALYPGQAQVYDMALDSPDSSESYLLGPTAPSPCNYTVGGQSTPASQLYLGYVGSGGGAVVYWQMGLDAADTAAYYTGGRGEWQGQWSDTYLFTGVGLETTPPMTYLISPTGDPPNPWGIAGMTYWNTVCHPQFSFFFPFEVDTTDVPNLIAPMHLQGAKSSWEVWDDTDSVWDVGYFKDIQQTYDLDAIPLDLRTQHRVHQAWPPFNSRGLGGMLDNPNNESPITPTTPSLSGFQGSYWWGTTGAKWLIPGSAGQGQVGSVLLGAHCADRWTYTDGTGTHPLTVDDSQLTIPAGQTTVEFDLTSWSNYPYGWTRIANQISIPDLPSENNVASWTLAMVGEDGEVRPIVTSSSSLPTTTSLYSSQNLDWSVSAAMNLGLITDSYKTILPADDSETVYLAADPGMVTSIEKLSAFSGTTLQICVTPTDATTECLFSVPTLLAPDASTMIAVALNSRDALIMAPDGPSLMVGPQLFWDGELLDTPEVDPYITNGQMSAGDIGMFYLSVFNPPAPGTTLDSAFSTLMQGIFVYGSSGTYEWTEPSDFWSDFYTGSQLSTGFVLGPQPAFVLMNSFSILPPLAMAGGEYPRLASNDWADSGTSRVQAGYSAASTRQYVVSPTGKYLPTLIAPITAAEHPGANCLQTDSTAPSGWSAQYMHDRVSNDETYTGPQDDCYSLQVNGIEYARYNPWRGVAFAPFKAQSPCPDPQRR